MAPCSHYTLDYRLEACNTSDKNGQAVSEDMLRENLIELEKGAVIAFEEYGNANGEPVIFCHGWPSSRIMARLTDDPARDLGVRIISPDRPGISGSSLQPDRKLTDWPRLVERIADHLAIRDFRMLAISGGAPYAYATAAAMPERVRAIAIVGGAPPIPLDARTVSNATGTVAKTIFPGTAVSLIAAACPSSSTGFKNAIVTAVRR